jgi:hypothetical protein
MQPFVDESVRIEFLGWCHVSANHLNRKRLTIGAPEIFSAMHNKYRVADAETIFCITVEKSETKVRSYLVLGGTYIGLSEGLVAGSVDALRL